jgi:hypothetical protein
MCWVVHSVRPERLAAQGKGKGKGKASGGKGAVQGGDNSPIAKGKGKGKARGGKGAVQGGENSPTAKGKGGKGQRQGDGRITLESVPQSPDAVRFAPQPPSLDAGGWSSSFLCLITPLCSYLYRGLYGALYEGAHIIRYFSPRPTGGAGADAVGG